MGRRARWRTRAAPRETAGARPPGASGPARASGPAHTPGGRASGGLEEPGAARRIALLLPPALLAAATVSQYVYPADIVFGAAFAAAPLVAAPLYSTRATALTGLLASATFIWLVHVRESLALFEGVLRATTVATVALLAVGLNRVVRRGAAQLASARDVAEAAQVALLPPPERRLGPLEIAARYQAAHTEASIGGDLYAVQDTPHGVRLLVGDVRGKGLDAVSAVAIVLGAFREAAEREPSLEAVAVRLDRALEREGRRREGTLDEREGFTTAVLAEVSDDGRLRLVNRGHPPPVLLTADGGVRLLEPPCPALPLGLADLPARDGEDAVAHETVFPHDATLLIHTDGLTEARDPRGVFYDLPRRLRVGGWSGSGPEKLLDALLADLAAYTEDGPTDDLALLAVTFRDDAERLR
ncbi:PP2C family protein-serine/threonine phosphatase [Streptomyces sp. TRM 70351]|uniref:PP2C family protein-serine/threonine phosphatase n=1 Tax=Streptomyces sp. TRM 70351 TaxID=3116552 RepID=UPI002E7B2186|nr:PP2C family protein-serine/threonine phosphatase [Streptomyces sp. TRM 70351]MEE1929781.1 PP2C family protein-serine/threonine phosphatase [Streptomyces sp. TRM 70351]